MRVCYVMARTIAPGRTRPSPGGPRCAATVCPIVSVFCCAVLCSVVLCWCFVMGVWWRHNYTDTDGMAPSVPTGAHTMSDTQDTGLCDIGGRQNMTIEGSCAIGLKRASHRE